MPKISKCKPCPSMHSIKPSHMKYKNSVSKYFESRIEDLYADNKVDELSRLWSGCKSKKYNTKNTTVSSPYLEELKQGKKDIDRDMKEWYRIAIEDRDYSEERMISITYDGNQRISGYNFIGNIEIVTCDENDYDNQDIFDEFNIGLNENDLDEADAIKLNKELEEYFINKHVPKIARMFVAYTPNYLKTELTEMMLAVKNPLFLNLLREIVNQMK